MILAILVAIITIGIVVLQDYSDAKEPFDDPIDPLHSEEFDIKKHWWKKRNDNVLIKVGCGLLGAILSKEIGMPIIQEYLSLPAIAEHAAELTSSFAVTFIFAKHFRKLFKKG